MLYTSPSNTKKPSVVAHTCNHRNKKAEAGGLLRVQGHLELNSEFKASMDNMMRPLIQMTNAREVGQSVEHVPCKPEDLSLHPQKACKSRMQ